MPHNSRPRPASEARMPATMMPDAEAAQPLDLDPEPRLGRGSGRPVGVHHHDPVVALGDLPLQLRVGAGGAGDPERLVLRRLGEREAVLALHVDPERPFVDVLDLVVGDAVEVGLQVIGPGDPEEQGLVGVAGADR
jgi:hypothetical protein